MGHGNINIGALIGSRICHDLISPIGAINNGIELLGMSSGNTGPEMQLISESVGNASARIRLFRIAYGAGSDQPMGRAEVVSILNDNMRGGRIDVQYGPLDAQPRWAIRMVFLAVQCLETAMPYGGLIKVQNVSNAWSVSGQSNKLNIDTDLWSWLNGDGRADITPPHVQFALLPEVAKDADRRLGFDTATEDTLTIAF